MKKNILFFLVGALSVLLVEAIIIFVVALINQSNHGYPGLTLFDEDGACINAKQIRIFQTLGPNLALADALTIPNAIFDENSILVLIIGDESTHFYDEQKINIPAGECARQVGTYQYTTNQNMLKTVPAVVVKQ